MKIVGLGDNVFDVYENQGVAYPGGNAVNVAVNAARLGAQAAYLGGIATDAAGDQLAAVLAAEGVSTALCPRPAGTTTKCCIEDVIDGERHWKRNDLGASWVGPLVLTDKQVLYLATADAVFTSCNAKMPGEMTKLTGIPAAVVFDFGEKEKYRTPTYLAQVLPAIDLAQFSMSGVSQEEAAAAVAQMGLACPILVTRGSAAPLMWLEGADGPVVAGAPSVGGPAVDTMGAGDAFVTALVLDLLEHGWRAGAPVAEATAHHALAVAARHAQQACREHGGFGHPFEVNVGEGHQLTVAHERHAAQGDASPVSL